jgi:hypothetical protein
MWLPLVIVLGVQWSSLSDVPLVKEEWRLERDWWLLCLFVGFGVAMPLYHLSKIFRISPRIVLDTEGIRGPIVPGRLINWSAIRTITTSSGQRAGVEYATWRLELHDGRTATVRGLATLNVPYADLFECTRCRVESGLLKLPPMRFWSRLWT